MKKQIFFALVVLILASLACSLGSSSGTSAEPQVEVLFEDDFSSTNSGWAEDRSAGIVDYDNDTYRILVDEAGYYYWSSPGKTFDGDVSVEVDATKTAGPDQNDFGIICRYDETLNNFYYLTMGSNGYAAIGLWLDADQTILAESDGNSFGAVDQTYRIKADCAGSKMTLSVDGKEILSAEDTTLTSGDAGLIVGTYDEPNVDVTFDNFLVFRP